MSSWPVHWRLKSGRWVFHRPVHWGLKYEQPAGPLEIEIETVSVPLAGPFGIEICAASQSVGD